MQLFTQIMAIRYPNIGHWVVPIGSCRLGVDRAHWIVPIRFGLCPLDRALDLPTNQRGDSPNCWDASAFKVKFPAPKFHPSHWCVVFPICFSVAVPRHTTQDRCWFRQMCQEIECQPSNFCGNSWYRWAQLKMDRRFGSLGEQHFTHFLHFIHFMNFIHFVHC